MNVPYVLLYVPARPAVEETGLGHGRFHGRSAAKEATSRRYGQSASGLTGLCNQVRKVLDGLKMWLWGALPANGLPFNGWAIDRLRTRKAYQLKE